MTTRKSEDLLCLVVMNIKENPVTRNLTSTIKLCLNLV